PTWPGVYVVQCPAQRAIVVYLAHEPIALIIVEILLHQLVRAVPDAFYQPISVVGHVHGLTPLGLLSHLANSIVGVVDQQRRGVIDLVQLVGGGVIHVVVVAGQGPVLVPALKAADVAVLIVATDGFLMLATRRGR